MGSLGEFGSVSSKLAVTFAVALLAGALATAAWGAGAKSFKVKLPVKVDETSHSIGGEVVSNAPYGSCSESKIRIREVVPGKNRVVAKVKPSGGAWHFAVPRKLRGKRLYAEVSGYELPKKPVVCRAARSHVVTAP